MDVVFRILDGLGLFLVGIDTCRKTRAVRVQGACCVGWFALCQGANQRESADEQYSTWRFVNIRFRRRYCIDVPFQAGIQLA